MKKPRHEIPTIGPHQFVGWFCEPDKLLGWRMTPGQQAWFVKPGIRTWLSINKDGFRGPEFPFRKDSEDRRILLLGDSFGVAIEVQEDETFPSLLQQKLDGLIGDHPGNFSLLNASVAGYGTEQEYLYLCQKGPELKPDIVLVSFHFGSDPIENCQPLRDEVHWRFVKLPRPYFKTGEDGELALVNFPPQPADLRKGWNHYYDYLPNELYKRRLALNSDPLWAQSYKGDLLQRLLRRLHEVIYKRRQKYILRTTAPLDARIYCTSNDANFEESWQQTTRLLAAIKQQAERLNARLVVAGICTKEQIIPEFLESRLPVETSNKEVYDPVYPSLRLEKILRNLSIPYIDLIPAFQRAQQDGDNLFHEYDLHWNPKGHLLAAETIWRTLEEFLR